MALGYVATYIIIDFNFPTLPHLGMGKLRCTGNNNRSFSKLIQYALLKIISFLIVVAPASSNAYLHWAASDFIYGHVYSTTLRSTSLLGTMLYVSANMIREPSLVYAPQPDIPHLHTHMNNVVDD